MDAQTLINTCQNDDFQSIRGILECKNQMVYFNDNAGIPPRQLQTLGLSMLFLTLEKNSNLIFGSLKHLNALHRLHSRIRFDYDASVLENCIFGNCADHYMDDFLLTIYACAESPFNGARQEALIFFAYWIQDSHIAHAVFERITATWAWTNRNKYYFLAIICDRHDFYELLNSSCLKMKAEYFLKGVTLSLQYRNLISPGQTLAISLTRKKVHEIFQAIANILRSGSNFELQNCINHWLHCIFYKEKVFDLLQLNSGDLLSSPQFAYLFQDNMLRLVLFRSCFKNCFEKSPNVRHIDTFIMSSDQKLDTVLKAPIFDVIITNTMNDTPRMSENLSYLEKFLKANMSEECSALRQDILKRMPNLMYLFASLLRNNENVSRIREFFAFLRHKIFEFGICQMQYQPLIFSLRLYEILMKTLYGSRTDRLIKKFNADVNNRLKAFLQLDELWPLCSVANYQRLLRLLQSDYDDVRDITCELLIRFFPQNDINELCDTAIRNQDIHKCSYAHYMARVAINMSDIGFYLRLRQYLLDDLPAFEVDPLFKVRNGHHLFGALNCINEFYSMAIYRFADRWSKDFSDAEIRDDIEFTCTLIDMLMRLLGGGEASSQSGSPSFEKMDASLTSLVDQSTYRGDDKLVEKKFLLLSLWMTLKACCDLASSIGVYMLDRRTDEVAVSRCFNVSATVLLQCRHKGAIEAAGLAMGRLVRCITARYKADTKMYQILVESVQQIFSIINKTDTTRRGAGFSIMVHNLVKCDRHRDRLLLKHVMDKLLAQGVEMHLSPAHKNRDNRLASVLHFLCVLVKDGELKSPLTSYMIDIFAIAIATIESPEWTVRNASLQLFGAIVPKLVGQTQYFENDIDWLPVYIVYTDIVIKSHRMHLKILSLLERCYQPSVLLVALLELLARIEVIGYTYEGEPMHNDRFKELFYRFVSFNSEKVRILAARCLSRFHKFVEIPSFVLGIAAILCETGDANFKHGLCLTMTCALKKYESDVRYTHFDERELLIDGVKAFFEHNQVRFDASSHYYLRFYFYDLLELVGFQRMDRVILNAMFGVERGSVIDAQEVRALIQTVDGSECEHIGFNKWKLKMLDIYQQD